LAAARLFGAAAAFFSGLAPPLGFAAPPLPATTGVIVRHRMPRYEHVSEITLST
jgi:hypothetical protein